VDQSATAATIAAGSPAAEGLGAAVVDEHLLATPQGFGYGLDRAALHARALDAGTAALRSLADAGIATVLDTTTIEAGRDPEVLRVVAEATGVRVLASTGIGSEETGVSLAFRALSSTQLADIFIAELTDAIPGSPLRAVAIVAELSHAARELDERSLLASAFAHAETGAPVLLRGRPERLPAAVDRLTARGVEPALVLALGLDRPETSFEILDALGRRGIAIGITAVADESRLAVAARATLAAYVLRVHGPARLCVGTGAVVTSPEGGTGGAEQFARFCEAVATFGAGELLRESLAAGPQRLLGGVA
jgi:predicted metal-dependent phosphotriesterase family hydrolase